MTELHRAVRRYAHDRKLVDLLGGVRSAIAELDALLARYAPGEPVAVESLVPCPSPAACALPSSAGSREWTDALLGVIAIRNHLSQALLAGAVAALDHDLVASRDEPEAEPSRSGPNLESLLR